MLSSEYSSESFETLADHKNAEFISESFSLNLHLSTTLTYL